MSKGNKKRTKNQDYKGLYIDWEGKNQLSYPLPTILAVEGKRCDRRLERKKQASLIVSNTDELQAGGGRYEEESIDAQKRVKGKRLIVSFADERFMRDLELKKKN